MLLPGQSVPATTTRKGATYLTNLTLRWVGAPTADLLKPVSPQFVFENFGETVTMPFMLYADYPLGSSDRLPVQPGDVIKRTDTGERYGVKGVKARVNWFLRIYVEILSE